MRSILKRGVSMMLACIILLVTLPASVGAATTEKITVEDYAIRLAKAIKLTPEETSNVGYVKIALEKGLLKESENEKLSNNISNQFAAVLTNRADQIMMGEKYEYNEKLYYTLIDKERISDIKKVSKGSRTAVYKMFSKGIMIGYSNGKYTQDRSFKPSTYLTLSEAKTIIKRLTTKSSRKKISADGQVIRTTNLPKNYKSYDYILASFPNSFYEEDFFYEDIRSSVKPVNLVDYASPKDLIKKTFKNYSDSYKMSDILAKYQDKWCKKVEDNLNYRLNVNYKTVNNDWITGLRNTYPIYDDKDMDSDYVNAIKQYVKIIKDNKVSIKTSQVIVEPSTMYYCSGYGYFVRCYVKFKITSASNFYTYESENQRLMIYGSHINLKGLKKNVWYEATFDVGLSGNNMNDDGSGYAVTTDWMYK